MVLPVANAQKGIDDILVASTVAWFNDGF